LENKNKNKKIKALQKKKSGDPTEALKRKKRKKG